MLQLLDRVLVAALALALAAYGGAPFAQTIADYSRSQRAVLEAEIARNTAKAMGVELSPAPAAVASASSTALAEERMPALRPTSLVKEDPAEAAMPSWAVAGVFMSSSRAVAEFNLEGATYMVAAGDRVPGTPWRVKSVSADKVVLVDRDVRRETSKRRTAHPARVLRLPVGGP